MIYVIEILDSQTTYVMGAYSSARKAHEEAGKYIEKHYPNVGLTNGAATYIVTTVNLDETKDTISP